ncbi:3-phosphoshikimate 1-carboxyvinyltransferase [Aureimonas ureilytica]|uniref:3-phosphoshikimate 1-carboxyvinyltransferase n=1 Tax=Aureimonas ureilytica TaxID=401562 RepID=UPI00037AF024|nr:3-phosphoshikimate 1-carboxyvinyltransferase [Aureimonas ureilytica]
MVHGLTIIPPTHPLRGRVSPPGSKSITNRALLLAALAKGQSRLTGALKSDDTRYMAQALRAMGVGIEEPTETSFLVSGTGGLAAPEAPLFLGNAGTAVRFLTAAAAFVRGSVTLTGDAHMQKRPIGPLIEAMRSLGIEAEAPSGCPPVTVRGSGSFEGDRVSVDAGLSSQYVSALLMLAPGGRGPVEIVLDGDEIGARGYIDLTCAAMRHFGADVAPRGAGSWLVQPGPYRAADFHVEPDASAATYLWAAEVLTGGAIDLGIAADDFTQPDAKAYQVIRQFPNLPAVIDGSQMQDAVPTLAALAAFNRTPVRFVGIANLRVKECDRVAAMATELSRLRPGLAVEEGDDLVVTPADAQTFAPARIETYADHRIAMSMALTGLRAPGVTITDPDCVGKTYPAYWQALSDLGVKLEPVAG